MRHLHGELSARSPLERGLSSIGSAKDDGAPRRARPAVASPASEHHLPTEHTLVALPLDAWPYLLAAMRRRTYGAGSWSGRLSPKQKELAVHLLAEIAARGPLCSEDFADTGRSRAVLGCRDPGQDHAAEDSFSMAACSSPSAARTTAGTTTCRKTSCPAKRSASLSPPEKGNRPLGSAAQAPAAAPDGHTLKRTELAPRLRPRPNSLAVEGCPTTLLPEIRPAACSISQPSALSPQLSGALGRRSIPLIYTRPVTAGPVEFRLQLGGLHAAGQAQARLLRAAGPGGHGTRRPRRPQGVDRAAQAAARDSPLPVRRGHRIADTVKALRPLGSA